MMHFHPYWQIAFTLLGCYVWWLGLGRFRSLHLGQNAAFKRGRHILLGQVTAYALLAGAVGGAVMARLSFNAWFVTASAGFAHAWVALAIALLLLAGLASGLYMAKNPAPRKALPLLHGLGNTLAILLALGQMYWGDVVEEAFLHH